MGGRVSYEYTNGSVIPVTSHSLDVSPSPTKLKVPRAAPNGGSSSTPSVSQQASGNKKAGGAARSRGGRNIGRGVSLPPKSASKTTARSPAMHFRNSYAHVDTSKEVETVDLLTRRYPVTPPVRVPAHEPSPFRSTGRDKISQY